MMPLDFEAELLERFEPGCIEPDFGARFLCAYAKADTVLSASQWQRYTLEADIKLHGSTYGQRFREKFYDSTFNFCLVHDGGLIGSVGFEIDGRAMDVWQIQGIKGEGERLRPIKWSHALLRYCVTWARRVGLSEVFVVSVRHNAWAATHGHLDPTRGKLLYDVTAKRCGFSATADGYYRLAL